MHPVLFQIFSFKLHTYGALMGAGFLLAMHLVLRRGQRWQIAEIHLNQVMLLAFVFGILGARLLYVLVDGPLLYLKQPLEIFKIWKGGLVYFGGFLMALLAISLYAKAKGLQLLQIFDLCTPPLVIAHAMGRLGCFMAGCCHGEECDLPWAVTFTHGVGLNGVPLHPTQIYASLFLIALYFTLLWIRNYQRFHGTIILAYLMIYPLGRSLLEFFRADFRGGLFGISTSQWISLPLFLLATGFFIHLSLNRRTKALTA